MPRDLLVFAALMSRPPAVSDRDQRLRQEREAVERELEALRRRRMKPKRGDMVCSRCGDPMPRYHHKLCSVCALPVTRIRVTDCVMCGRKFVGHGQGCNAVTCGATCRAALKATRARDKARMRQGIRRIKTESDITPQQEAAMRRKVRKCPMPGCGVWMTSRPCLPNSKELDHILPINQGGTHTHGNVRIICRECNQRRPKDGSDYLGTFTLWAQAPGVSVARRRKAA
jgi:5-methylcytosine-specific restriction endonuclease McrA